MAGCNFAVTVDAATDNLVNTNFTGAVASNCIFDGSAGDGTIFAGAQLDGTSWKPVPDPSFSGNFLIVILLRADFHNANLNDAKLNGIYCANGNFQGANLSGTDFTAPPGFTEAYGGPIVTYVRLSSFSTDPNSGVAASLSGATLPSIDFGSDDLSGADLSHATLTGSTFAGANLSGATLTGVTPADIFGQQSLAGTNFSGVAFAGLDLSAASFSGAILSEPNQVNFADFSGATLTNGTNSGVGLAGQVFPPQYAGFAGANLAYADLTGASLYQADLAGANLTNATAVGANFEFASLAGSTLSGLQAGLDPNSPATPTSFAYAYMPNSDLRYADLRLADFSNAHIYTSNPATPMNFTGAKLDYANFSNAIVAAANLTQASAAHTAFTGAFATNIDFNSAVLTESEFIGAYLEGADFTGAAANMTGVNFTNATFSMACDPNDPNSVCIYDPNSAAWVHRSSWTYTDQNGQAIPFSYGLTNLAGAGSVPTIYWPSGQTGTLTLQLAVPQHTSPYPPAPPCLPVGPCYCNCTGCGPNGNRRPCQ